MTVTLLLQVWTAGVVTEDIADDAKAYSTSDIGKWIVEWIKKK